MFGDISSKKIGEHVLVGGKPAAVIFVLMLLSFVVESQLTQYVETDLGFGQPYLLFYIVHSAFVLVFPLHLLYLHFTSSTPVRAYIDGLKQELHEHLSKDTSSKPSQASFPLNRLLLILTWCTVGITLPALLWFAAITLASVSDVTAIWNSNAFWAYVIAVKFQHSTWEPRRLAAVIAASIGVLCVVYGAKGLPSSPSEDGLKAPLVGNLLTLVASLGYGFYQVAYNLYAVPPSESELDLEHDNWQRLPTSSDGVNGQSTDERQTEGATLVANATVPSPPIGLYANALTCGIGIMTLLVLWIPIPVLHFMSIEPFKRPQDLRTVISIAGITISGLTFNATFMILLGVWGPIITSVGNLLTIVLVLISDLIFGHAASTLTIWSILGSGMIVCAFAVLASETLRQ